MIEEQTLEDLRKKYAIPDTLFCFICEKELEVQAVGGGPTKWACTNGPGARFSPEWLDHYRRSSQNQYEYGDSRVMELIEAYEELKWRMDGLEK